MRFKRKIDSPLRKMARKGNRGVPFGTVAFYGPDDTRASKVAATVLEDGEGVTVIRRWHSDELDLRKDRQTEDEILEFFRESAVRTVVITDHIIGCPHQEGKDYPEGGVCPMCPFWHNRDRFAALR